MPHKCNTEETQKKSLRGKVVVMGDVCVENEHLCGVFVECAASDLKQYSRNLFGKDVVITPDINEGE